MRNEQKERDNLLLSNRTQNQTPKDVFKKAQDFQWYCSTGYIWVWNSLSLFAAHLALINQSLYARYFKTLYRDMYTANFKKMKSSTNQSEHNSASN